MCLWFTAILFKLLFTIASHFLPDCITFRFKYIQLLDNINKQSYSTPNIKNPTLKFLPHRKLTPDVTISLTRSLTWTEFCFIYNASHVQNCTSLSRISSNTHSEEENRTGSPALTYFLVTCQYHKSRAACKVHIDFSLTMSKTRFLRWKMHS